MIHIGIVYGWLHIKVNVVPRHMLFSVTFWLPYAYPIVEVTL